MRSAGRHGTRRWLPLAAVPVLVVSGVAASGCSSSPSAYCTAASQLKTSVHNLGNVNVAKNGLSSLQTALGKVLCGALAPSLRAAAPRRWSRLVRHLARFSHERWLTGHRLTGLFVAAAMVHTTTPLRTFSDQTT